MPRWTSKGSDWQETGTQSRQIRDWGWNSLVAVSNGLLEWKSVRSSRNSFSKSKPWQAITGWIHTKKSSLFQLFSPSFEDRPNTTGKEKRRHRMGTTKQRRERNKLLRLHCNLFHWFKQFHWHWKATNDLIRKYKIRIFCPPTHSTPCLNVNIKFSSLCSSVNNTVT